MRLSRSSAALLAGSLAGCLHGEPAASCPTDRVLAIASQDDVTAHATCTTARGVQIRTGATVDVAQLRGLVTITGDLVIGPTVGIETVQLTELREVSGAILVSSNGSMHGLFFPLLERAGRIAIEGNVSLTSIALPRLETVTGGITIADNHDLEVVDAAALAQVGGDLVIENHPELTLLELPRLQSAAAVRLDRDPKLPADVVAAVRAHAASP